MGFWVGQFDGNPFVGLYARASDQRVLVPRGAPEKFLFGMKSLEVPAVKTSVDGSPYVGIYLALNSNGIIAPPFLTKTEKTELEALGLDLLVLPDTRYSAVANNICCNDKGALVNPDMPASYMPKIEKALGVPVKQHPLAGYRTVGAMMIATNKGWVAPNRTTAEEAGLLEDLFTVKGSNGTVNSGTAFVGLGMAANSKGAAVGETTSGFEQSRIQQALDLI